MAKQAPWDGETDMFIADLEPTISKKYNVTFRSILMNPERYLNKKDISTSVKNIKVEVERYFSDLLSDLQDEQKKLQSELESATAQYRQVDSIITNKSAVARVPYVKPLFVTRNPDKEEAIIIDKYEEGIDSLIGKLINNSSYVADVSAKYKSYLLGSWLFSGAKNYVLTINPPISPVLAIENSRAIISGILDDVANRASR